MHIKFIKYFLLITTILFFNKNFVFANESYFDLSEEKIEILTNFNGKEVIIFGLTEPEFDIILTIKGPRKDTSIRKKERFFGFWFNTQKLIYKNLPSIFFISSSKPVKEILSNDLIIKEALYFEEMLIDSIETESFANNTEKQYSWDQNLIKIKKNDNFYKEYKLKIVDEKLFQSKIFFPSNTVPGTYEVNIFKIKNNKIVNSKNKNLIIKRAGIGNKIFKFAHDHPAAYGIICIFFAAFAGLIAATIFRRL